MHASEALATTGCIVCRTVWSKCSNIQPFAAKLPKSPHAQTLRCNKRTTGMDRLHTVQCVVHHICMSQGKASAPHQRVTRDHMQRSSRTARLHIDNSIAKNAGVGCVPEACSDHQASVRNISMLDTMCWKPHCRAASMTDSIWLSHDTIGISTSKLQLVRHTPC